jgi:hypothetical protein
MKDDFPIGGVLLAMMMIMTVSRAAFSDVTSYNDSTLATGSVVLYNEDNINTAPGDENGGFLFQVANAKPGESASACVEIIYDGTIDANVELEAVNVGIDSTPALAPVMDLQIDRYTASGCSVADHDAIVFTGDTLANWSDMESAWSAGDSRWYGVTVTLQDVDNSYQSLSASDIDFQWIANQA